MTIDNGQWTIKGELRPRRIPKWPLTYEDKNSIQKPSGFPEIVNGQWTIKGELRPRRIPKWPLTYENKNSIQKPSGFPKIVKYQLSTFILEKNSIQKPKAFPKLSIINCQLSIKKCRPKGTANTSTPPVGQAHFDIVVPFTQAHLYVR